MTGDLASAISVFIDEARALEERELAAETLIRQAASVRQMDEEIAPLLLSRALWLKAKFYEARRRKLLGEGHVSAESDGQFLQAYERATSRVPRPKAGKSTARRFGPGTRILNHERWRKPAEYRPEA